MHILWGLRHAGVHGMAVKGWGELVRTMFQDCCRRARVTTSCGMFACKGGQRGYAHRRPMALQICKPPWCGQEDVNLALNGGCPCDHTASGPGGGTSEPTPWHFSSTHRLWLARSRLPSPPCGEYRSPSAGPPPLSRGSSYALPTCTERPEWGGLPARAPHWPRAAGVG